MSPQQRNDRRAMFAASALQGLLAMHSNPNCESQPTRKDIVDDAIRYAGAMMFAYDEAFPWQEEDES